MSSEQRYAEVDSDGRVVHVCRVLVPEGQRKPDLAETTLKAIPAGQVVEPGAHRVVGGRFVEVDPAPEPPALSL